MTIADWEAMPEDDSGELVDGRVEEEEVPDLTHETVVAWLVRMLGAWIITRGGFVFGSEAKFVVGPQRGRKPDVTVYFPGARLPRHGAVRVPPAIAIEVVTPTPRDRRRDRIDKVADYAAFGVRWFWIVDPEQRSVEILELDARRRRYVHVLGVTEGALRIPGCDGLDLDLDALWADVDRLVDTPVGRRRAAPRRPR